MPFCPNCGSQITSNAKFCMNCGASIQNEQSTDNTNSNQNGNSSISSAIIGFVNTAKSGIESAINKANNSTPPPTPSSIHQDGADNSQGCKPLKNCPSCGAPINSFAARCPNCGVETSSTTQATACQELCNRLDYIESTRPKESIFTFVTGLANKALDNHSISPTDQQKIELISNFIVPNTKADILEFIFLAQTRIKSCQELSKTSTDEYVSLFQGELQKVWEAKLDQTIEKARIVLANDPEFSAVLRTYTTQKFIQQGVCQYCGGKFKGVFTKVCTKCGRPKDY